MTEKPDTIATTAGELTPEWLTAALASSGTLPEGRVTSVSTSPLGTGQMCDCYRVALTYDRDTTAPPSLVAKLPSTDEGTRLSALMLRNYEKEVRFYQSFAATLDVGTPAHHYAEVAEVPDRFVLLLDDMAPAAQGDQLAGCGLDVAEEAVGELVGLHAPHWADPALADHDWLAETMRPPGFGPLLAPLWPGFIERYGDRVTSEIVTAGNQLFDRIDRFLAMAGAPTLVHGDFRLDNLLIHPSTGAVSVVDWQTVAVGTAAYDVAYLLGASLSTDDRRDHEEALVRRYHEGLVDAGVTGFGWDECWADYRRGAFTGLLMAIGASMIVERTDRGDEMFLTMATRHSRQVLDLGSAAVLDAEA